MYNYDRHPNLILKLKVPFALKDGEKIALEYAPVRKENGTVLIPAFIKEFGGKTETFEGKEYFALDTLAANKKFDEMGCIILDKEIAVSEINREDDLDLMLHWMGEFIFDYERVPMQKSYAPATPEERAGFRRIGLDIKARLLARENKHPYLFATQEIFDKIHDAYMDEKDTHLKDLATKLLPEYEKNFTKEKYAMNADMTALISPLDDPYEDGYDHGGRAADPNDHLTACSELALAYQITRDTKYARLAYLIMKEMIRRPHWGPGHFLNTSVATLDYCETYDWLYNIWKDLGYDLKDITRGIYSHGILQSYNSMIFDKCDYPSPKQGTGWRFKLKPDNWNAVCNTGSIVGAAMLICEGKGGYITDQVLDVCTEQIGASLASLTQDGLVLKQYATDGSYVESNSYWSYGTNNLFRILAALKSLIGTDLGLHYTWGLDKTCYYAINTESAEYVGWNYHDGGLGEQSTYMFYPFGYISGDKNLYALRREHLKMGKEPYIFDLLYEPEILGEAVPDLKVLPLDYHMESIDGFTVRSGWERGSIYAGILGGKNTGGHTQIDAGCFVYHNYGKLWFTDLGSDCYNLPGGYFSNNNLFRRNAEGNNTLFLPSLPHGQIVKSRSPIIECKSSDSASYAIIDTTPAYGEKAVKVMRGMLLTADRRTWVLRDEAEFSEAENACWVANFKSKDIRCELAKDGRSCRMSYEDGSAIEVHLFSDADVRFEIISCYDFLLKDTQPKVEGEYSREAYSRLLVRFNGLKKFNFSIVAEPIGDAALYDIPFENWKNI